VTIERRGAAATVSAAGRRLVGYAARFGVEAQIGSFRERIAPGAFAASLASGRDILALVDHDPKALLGRTRTGTLTLREDADGLAFELALPDTRAAADILALAERGDIGGMSFGFVATDDAWEGELRELRAVELHEISIVQSVAGLPADGSQRAQPEVLLGNPGPDPPAVAGHDPMNFLRRLFERRSLKEGGFDRYWSSFAASRSGTVTPARAESVSAVYACVQAVAETIASLPLILYRRTEDGGRDRATDHPLYRVLHDQPNEIQTALELREQLQAAVLLRGNAFARIGFGFDGRVRELVPIHPDRVQVVELDNGRLGYDVTDARGQRSRLVQEEVLHLRHRTDDGLVGVSPIAAAREVFELAIAERDHGVSTFRNGTRLSGILQTPGAISVEQQRQLADAWHQRHEGAANHGKTAVLGAGIEFKPVSMTLEDAEWIAARQFSVEEVARLFRVPPTMIGDLRHGNYSNSVEMARQFVTMTLRRHLTMWEQAISRSLLTDAGRRLYFAEHSVEGLLRGDSLNRAQFYERGIADGWLDTDEVRRLENLPARRAA